MPAGAQRAVRVLPTIAILTVALLTVALLTTCQGAQHPLRVLAAAGVALGAVRRSLCRARPGEATRE